MGGSDVFCSKLDTLFTLEKELSNEGFSSDVSGLIGQYAHGNEPSHHVAYMYAMAGQPHKTQEMIRHICRSQYKDAVDGLCGNDDCGQMSAWYIFSVLGFYPVDPCGGEYILGAPQVPEAEISLPDGKVFRMVAEGLSEDNKYVERVELNGKKLDGLSISHDDVMAGGELRFYMTDK
jgi:predicted alpha-1,2-mannosidase